MFNKFIAVNLLLFFSPVIFVAMITIIAVEGENPIFIQDRVGKNRKMFKIIKLKTMVNNKITKTGYFLRKYRLDELTQFINVIKGDMNIIGPRPLIKSEYDEQDESFYDRTVLLPGITGWAQINGPLANPPDKINYDRYYIINKSLKLDLYIVYITFWTLLTGKRLKDL